MLFKLVGCLILKMIRAYYSEWEDEGSPNQLLVTNEYLYKENKEFDYVENSPVLDMDIRAWL